MVEEDYEIRRQKQWTLSSKTFQKLQKIEKKLMRTQILAETKMTKTN